MKNEFSEPVIFKKAKIKNFKLKEGEDICKRCNGWGELYDTHRGFCFTCDNCLGEGKLDWVENVVGKKVPTPLNGTSFQANSYLTFNKLIKSFRSDEIG